MGVSEWVRLFFSYCGVLLLFSFCSEFHQSGHRAKTALKRSLFFLRPLLLLVLPWTSPEGRGSASGRRTSAAWQQTTRHGTGAEWKSGRADWQLRMQTWLRRDEEDRRQGGEGIWHREVGGVEKAGESGRTLPGYSSGRCLKRSGGLFPLLSLLMSFLCSCVFYTPCDGRCTPPPPPPDGSVLFHPAIHHCM